MTFHYAEQLSQSKEAIEATLAWSAQFPEALYRRSVNRSDNSTKELIEAIFQNPTDGRFFLALAEKWVRSGQIGQADKSVAWTTELMPSNAQLRLAAAQYWVGRNNIKNVLDQWNGAIIASPRLKKQLYPYILQWSEEPRYIPEVLNMFASGTPWWSDFFNYAANNAIAIRTVATLFENQRKTKDGVTIEDRRVYIARLQRDGFWRNAYIEWLNSLNRVSLQGTAPLFNGSFEIPVSNMGFDWHNEESKGAIIETRHTYGVRGGKALHLVFANSQVPFKHFRQPLLLVPGRYRLRGLTRVDNLLGQPGVRWEITCIFGRINAQDIAKSEYFSGIESWREFTVEFTIPQGCEVQAIRLTSGPNLVQPLKGEVWFDDLSIRKITSHIN